MSVQLEFLAKRISFLVAGFRDTKRVGLCISNGLLFLICWFRRTDWGFGLVKICWIRNSICLIVRNNCKLFEELFLRMEWLAVWTVVSFDSL